MDYQDINNGSNGHVSLTSLDNSCPSSSQQDKLEAIVVIGFSLKLPEDAISPGAFWTMMEEKRCVMTEWPSNRINLDAFYHPESERRDTVDA